MTLNLQQVITDRKEGTPGEWDAALERGCHGVIAAMLPKGGANFVAMVGNDAGTQEREPTRFANARRIARVPALEAFYITHHNAPAVYAAAERLAEIAGKTAKGPEDFAELAEALQELRKAMGKPSDPETLAMIDALRHGDA